MIRYRGIEAVLPEGWTLPQFRRLADEALDAGRSPNEFAASLAPGQLGLTVEADGEVIRGGQE